ncbi:MAG: CopD family protein [Gemmatimonadota bacterium]|nr:CopD family protein [Gemmatimonadota bacterium]
MIRRADHRVPRRWTLPLPRSGGLLRKLGLAIALFGGAATPALAHQTLLRAAPAAGDQLTTLPGSLRLFFREPIQGAFTRITLLGPDSGEVALGALRVEGDSGTVAALAITGRLAEGRYTVAWRTTGLDGHAVEGSYAFTVLAEAVPPLPDSSEVALGPLQDDTPTPSRGTSARLKVESVWYVLVRWLGFLALLGVLGAAAFRLVVLPLFGRGNEPPSEEFSRQLSIGVAGFGCAAALSLLAVGVARLVAQGATMLSPVEPVTLEWFAALVGGTMWGKGWLLQMAGAAAAWIGFRSLKRRGGSGAALLVLLAALTLALVPALSGHAIAMTQRTGLAVLADWIHVLAAGGWVGGLAVLLLVGLPVIHRQAAMVRGPLVARLVQAFSPPALLLGGIVVGTGLVGAWFHLGSLPALWSTRYGLTLLIKLAIVGVLFALGGLNFLRVRPALGTDAGTARLRRSAGAELTVGFLVLLVTSVLVALPPARTESHTPEPAAAPVALSPATED